MNKNMKIFYTLGAVVLFLSFSLTGCDNLFEPPAAKTKTEGEKGLVVFQFGLAGSRTVMPGTFTFSEYELTLEPQAGQNDGDDIILTNANSEELETGLWKVYAVIYDSGTPIATGEEEFTVTGSPTQGVVIELEFSSLNGKGTIVCDITSAEEPDEAGVLFIPLSGSNPPSITLNPSTNMTGTDSNADAGYYFVIVRLKKDYDEAVYTEVVHIYPGQITRLTKTFYENDFHPIVTTYTATANGALDTTTSTAINFVFYTSVTNLNVDQVEITDDTGEVTPDTEVFITNTTETTGTSAFWSIALTDVAKAGNVKVTIIRADVETAEKTVAVHKRDDTPTTYTVTFDLNLPDWVPQDTPPTPVTVTSPATTVEDALDRPEYPAGWRAGVGFRGWHTGKTGGTLFEEDTDVDANITVYAHWGFEPGSAQTENDTLVHIAPQMDTNEDEVGTQQDTYDGDDNTQLDGSVTLRGGAVRYMFPSGYGVYDFVKLDYIQNGGLHVILKQGVTYTDYIPYQGGQYSQYPTLSASGSFTFEIINGVDGIAFQCNDDTAGTIKWTKATFTKAPDTSKNKVVEFGTGAGKTEVTASGGAAIDYGTDSFTVTYDTDGNENVISRFKVDLGTDTLADYTSVSFTANGIEGDCQWKKVFVFASNTESAVTGYKDKTLLSDITIGGPKLGTDSGVDDNWYLLPVTQTGSKTDPAVNVTINIDNAGILGLTGEVWFGIFVPADATGGGEDSKFEFGNVTFTAK
jgi:hypothetical protein